MSRTFLPHVITDDSALGGLEIERSLRFNDGDSAHLNRTPSSAGNRKTWTLSVWVKRITIDANQRIFTAYDGSNVNAECNIQFQSDGKIQINNNNTSSNTDTNLKTNRLFRDPSAWYHIVIGTDMTQGTSSNRVNLYINGTQETSFSTESYGTQNVDWWFNNNSLQTIGRRHNTTERPFDGYMAEFNFIDGSQLDPSYFGFTESQTGIWRPKRFDKSSIPNKKGRTFSSTWTASGNGFGGSNPITNAFDGDLSTSANNDGGGQILTWNTSTYNLRGELRIYCRSSSGVYDIYVNGNSGNTTKVGDTPSSNGWVDCGTFDHIKEIQFAGTTYNTGTGLGSAGVHILAIMVDGTLLRDDMDEFGTNGFRLDFSDNSSTAALGIDKSPNGNDYTPNNFSVSAGVGNDSLEDTPTNNFCTLNSLNTIKYNDNYDTILEEGGLLMRGGDNISPATMLYPKSGKWYCEFSKYGNGYSQGVSVVRADADIRNLDGVTSHSSKVTITTYVELLVRGSSVSNNGTAWDNDADAVIGVAVDMDNGAMYFAINNTWINSGVPTSGSAKTGAVATDLLTVNDGHHYVAAQGFNGDDNAGMYANFGQQAFAYTPPSGYKTLSTKNLPPNVPSLVTPKRNFDTLLYSGDDATTRSITGFEFAPDLIIIKRRNGVSSFTVCDSVRGVNKALYTEDTYAETTSNQYGYITEFGSNGFTFSLSSGYEDGLNASGSTYCTWCWKAGGSSNTFNVDGKGYTTAAAAGITDGSTALTGASVNTEAGFSIVTYTGTGSLTTVAHGLNGAPEMIWTKSRSATGSWGVLETAVNTTAESRIHLDDNGGYISYQGYKLWGDTVPTSSVFTVREDTSTNASGVTYVAYCWRSIPGYSKIGKYTGNGSTDGSHVYLGFRPAFVLLKRTSASASWVLHDNKRSGYNGDNDYFHPDNTQAESDGSTGTIDFLSNGFKLRMTAGTHNDGTFFYMAFAEQPGTTPFDTFPNAR